MDQQPTVAPAPTTTAPPAGEPYFLDPANPDAPTSFPRSPATPEAISAAHPMEDDYQVTNDNRASIGTDGARAETDVAITTTPTDNSKLDARVRAIADSDEGLSAEAAARGRYGDQNNYVEADGTVRASPDGLSGSGRGELVLGNEELRGKLGGGMRGLGTENPTGDMHGDVEYGVPGGPIVGVHGEGLGIGGAAPSGSIAARSVVPLDDYRLYGTGGVQVTPDGDVVPAFDVGASGPIAPGIDAVVHGGYEGGPDGGGTMGAKVKTGVIPGVDVGLGVEVDRIGNEQGPAVTPGVTIETEF